MTDNCKLKTNGFLEEMAYADAEHDMGKDLSTLGIIKPTADIVKKTIPNPTKTFNNLDKGHGVELMSKHIADEFLAVPTSVQPVQPVQTVDSNILYKDAIYGEHCDKNYKRYYIPYEKGNNLFDTMVEEIKIGDFLLIVDTCYSSIKTHLKQYTQSNKFVFLKSPETDYDPAGKTNILTRPDIFNNKSGKQVYFGNVKPNTQNATTIYTQWNDGDNWDLNEKNDIGKVFYSNRDLCILKYRSNIDNDNYNWKDLNSWVYMKKDGVENISNSKYAAIQKSVISKAMKNEYKVLGKELLSNSFDSEYNYETQVVSKRLGDASQAISCLKTYGKDDIQLWENETTKNVMQLNDLLHNVFVSIDRLAIVYALKIGCKIIVFDNNDGFYLYISNDVINPDVIVDTINTNINDYNHRKQANPTNNGKADIYKDGDNSKTTFENFKSNLITVKNQVKDFPTPIDDEQYKNLIINTFIYIEYEKLLEKLKFYFNLITNFDKLHADIEAETTLMQKQYIKNDLYDNIKPTKRGDKLINLNNKIISYKSYKLGFYVDAGVKDKIKKNIDDVIKEFNDFKQIFLGDSFNIKRNLLIDKNIISKLNIPNNLWKDAIKNTRIFWWRTNGRIPDVNSGQLQLIKAENIFSLTGLYSFLIEATGDLFKKQFKTTIEYIKNSPGINNKYKNMIENYVDPVIESTGGQSGGGGNSVCENIGYPCTMITVGITSIAVLAFNAIQNNYFTSALAVGTGTVTVGSLLVSYYGSSQIS